MAFLKKIGQSPRVQALAGGLIASYFRFVWKTARVTYEPADALDMIDANLPVIYAMWHGQHFLAPVARRQTHRAAALISKSRDGEINAIAARKMGVEAVRGSGAPDPARMRGKGGIAAFRDMVDVLNGGVSIALTADVPKIAKKAGLGVVMLAKYSGRPIMPVAIATKRRIDVNSWDKTSVNLPFSNAAVVVQHPIFVPADADDAALEAYRQRVEAQINLATERAYALAERRG